MKNKIINIAKPLFDKKESNLIREVLKSGWITSGKITIKLEKLISRTFKAKYVLAINSCTSGILASLVALKAKKNDEVITPAFTYVSTIQTIINLGLKIKFCDIDPLTLNIDCKKLKKLISKKTKFIIPVNNNGIPCDIENILKFTKKKKIKIILDAATSIGSKINKQYIFNNKNLITVFSLHGNKIIASGEGGIVCLNNKKIYNKLRLIINSGIEKSSWERNIKSKYNYLDSKILGYKLNFNDIHAAIALVQFKKLKKLLNKRKKLYNYYLKLLKKLLNNNILRTPKINSKYSISYYNFPIILINNNKRLRNKLSKFLKKNNIQSTIHYTPAHKHTFYKNSQFRIPKLINTDYIFDRIISLPMHNHLLKKDIKRICKIIYKFFGYNDNI